MWRIDLPCMVGKAWAKARKVDAAASTYHASYGQSMASQCAASTCHTGWAKTRKVDAPH
jgi:hypothetical protein